MTPSELKELFELYMAHGTHAPFKCFDCGSTDMGVSERYEYLMGELRRDPWAKAMLEKADKE